MVIVTSLLGLVIWFERPVVAQGADSIAVASDLPRNALETVDLLNVSGADVREVLRAIASRHDVNLIVTDDVTGLLTAKLSGMTVVDLFRFICRETNLSLIVDGGVFKVTRPPAPPPIPPSPVNVTFENGLLSADLENVSVERLAQALQSVADVSIVVAPGVSTTVTGYLNDVPLIEGLRSLLMQHGLNLVSDGAVLLVQPGDGPAIRPAGRLDVTRNGDAFSVVAVDAPVGSVLNQLSGHGAQIAQHADFGDERVSLNLSGVTLDVVLSAILRGTKASFSMIDGTYLIGAADNDSYALKNLFRLKHARADQVIEHLPSKVSAGVDITLINQLNGLLLVGRATDVYNVIQFLEVLDQPTPQILIEALVVDYKTTELKDLGVTLGRGEITGDGSFQPYSLFGAGDDQSGGLVYQGDGAEANSFLQHWKDLLGVGVGNLPGDFVFRIQALEQEGKANIVSRPQIATINGNTARISIGTTQYYILTSTTPLQSPNQIITQETERFERIEANVSLEITPWVTSTGEVTVEIHPEFSTPVGGLNPGVPPTISSRILDSTVRLRDGETIILGGLIQESDETTYNKVPVLGSIPLIGKLFRNRRVDRRKSELVIYITPHVFDGTADSSRWESLTRSFQSGSLIDFGGGIEASGSDSAAVTGTTPAEPPAAVTTSRPDSARSIPVNENDK